MCMGWGVCGACLLVLVLANGQRGHRALRMYRESATIGREKKKKKKTLQQEAKQTELLRKEAGRES